MKIEPIDRSVDTVHLVRARTLVHLPRSWTKLPSAEHGVDAAPVDDSEDPADCSGASADDGDLAAVAMEGVEEHTLALAFDRAAAADGDDDGATAAGLLWRGVACQLHATMVLVV